MGFLFYCSTSIQINLNKRDFSIPNTKERKNQIDFLAYQKNPKIFKKVLDLKKKRNSKKV